MCLSFSMCTPLSTFDPVFFSLNLLKTIFLLPYIEKKTWSGGDREREKKSKKKRVGVGVWPCNVALMTGRQKGRGYITCAELGLSVQWTLHLLHFPGSLPVFTWAGISEGTLTASTWMPARPVGARRRRWSRGGTDLCSCATWRGEKQTLSWLKTHWKVTSTWGRWWGGVSLTRRSTALNLKVPELMTSLGWSKLWQQYT